MAYTILHFLDFFHEFFVNCLLTCFVIQTVLWTLVPMVDSRSWELVKDPPKTS